MVVCTWLGARVCLLEHMLLVIVVVTESKSTISVIFLLYSVSTLMIRDQDVFWLMFLL